MNPYACILTVEDVILFIVFVWALYRRQWRYASISFMAAASIIAVLLTPSG